MNSTASKINSSLECEVLGRLTDGVSLHPVPVHTTEDTGWPKPTSPKICYFFNQKLG